ncbi:chitodextrinase [Bradyrhizobium diazoefficiens]
MNGPTPEERRAVEARISPQRRTQIEGFVAALAPEIADFVVAVITPLKERIKELESRPTLCYRGIWDASRTYQPGSFVTHSGSVWHADVQSTGIRPGEGGFWKLAVKRGSK